MSTCGCCDYYNRVYKLSDHISIRDTYGYCMHPYSLNYEPDFEEIQRLKFKGLKVQKSFGCQGWQMIFTKCNQ